MVFWLTAEREERVFAFGFFCAWQWEESPKGAEVPAMSPQTWGSISTLLSLTPVLSKIPESKAVVESEGSRIPHRRPPFKRLDCKGPSRRDSPVQVSVSFRRCLQ